jgi:uncharacterized protein (TIGR02145 family)
VDTTYYSNDYTAAIPWNSSLTYGSIVDGRDQKKYRTVVIGNQTWMAQNLDYRDSTGGTDTFGLCYIFSSDSCLKYGRLYSWSEAMNGSGSSATAPSGVRGICPSGWHVPSADEWDTLISHVGGDASAIESSTGWSTSSGSSDTYGFRALPGGTRYDYSGSWIFYHGSGQDYATFSSATSPSTYPELMVLSNESSFYGVHTYSYDNYSSLRCVQDD